MTESEKTIHDLENKLDSMNIHDSKASQLELHCLYACGQLQRIINKEKLDVLMIERAERLKKEFEEIIRKVKDP